MTRRWIIQLALGLLVGLPMAAFAERHGINPAYMDTKTSPCQDFYRYANGAWLDTVTIPADAPATSSGKEMRDRNAEALRRILEEAAARGEKETDPTLRKLGALYGTCMDEAAIERVGLSPIAEELRRIDQIRSVSDLQPAIARLHRLGIQAGFDLDAEPDLEDSTLNFAYVGPGGLGLPERDFYTRTDAESVELRKAYAEHVANMLTLLGAPAERARAEAEQILRLETALAEATPLAADLRDPKTFYRRMTVGDLQKLVPSFDWQAYFTSVGVPALASPSARLSASTETFLRTLEERLTSTPIEAWRAYLRWHLAHQEAEWLSKPLFEESFRFDSRLSGAQQPLPRWRRCADAADELMGEAVGKAYVEKEFTPAAKARMLELVNNLRAVFRQRIERNPWMSEATRREAFAKLENLVTKIGYPDRWRDYSPLQVSPQEAFGANVLRAQEFEAQRQTSQIGKPVDRTEWQMSPATVNAYASTNEITFPAGFLQPPMFDPQADDAVNYGAIGLVIGHELTHHFDDQGRQFDAKGNLRDWWTAEDAKAFEEQARKAVVQYDAYKAGDLHLNGKLTLGENIADLGGVAIAYDALQRALEGKPRPLIDGFTPEQRFFLGGAQALRTKMRPEMERQFVLTDEHSPPRFRVIGAASNLPEFAKAFGCKEGDPMVRPEAVRVRIW